MCHIFSCILVTFEYCYLLPRNCSASFVTNNYEIAFYFLVSHFLDVQKSHINCFKYYRNTFIFLIYYSEIGKLHNLFQMFLQLLKIKRNLNVRLYSSLTNNKLNCICEQSSLPCETIEIIL